MEEDGAAPAPEAREAQDATLVELSDADAGAQHPADDATAATPDPERPPVEAGAQLPPPQPRSPAGDGAPPGQTQTPPLAPADRGASPPRGDLDAVKVSVAAALDDAADEPEPRAAKKVTVVESLPAVQHRGLRVDVGPPPEKTPGSAELDTEAYCRRMWQGQSNILVVVRVRPLLKHDLGDRHIVKVLERKVCVILDPQREDDRKNVLRQHRSREKKYAFDYVFDEEDRQLAVYNRTTKFLIQGVLDGFNATVFAYGQTGAGKTFTMIGSHEEPGIAPRGNRTSTFSSSAKPKSIRKARARREIKVTVSFLEVYNENIRDLLGSCEDPADVGGAAKEASEFLDLREDPLKGPVVAGITEIEANSATEVMALLQRGNAKRSQHATAANEVSSRSHAVLQITVETREQAEGTRAAIQIGKLSLVDLAGSERAANTKNRGDRLKEGANINRSLLTLGNCINALGDKSNRGQFVPYRDSKLTRLLKDSLGGNCRTVMIANISASNASFEETLNTLKYANRAKNIKTDVKRNVLEVNHHISEYVSLIQNLRNEVTVLKQQLANSTTGPGGAALEDLPLDALLDAPRASAPARVAKTPGADKAALKEMKAWMQENFRERMQLRRTLIELEDQNVQNSIEIGKRQIIVADWNASRVQTPKAGPSGDRVAVLLADAPEHVTAAYGECEQLRKAIEKNGRTKGETKKRLRENEKGAERFHAELRNDRRVTSDERRELLELMYRIGNLELGNMQLEQAQVIHSSVVKGKDLTIQKLQLQLLMRDKVIAQQRDILKANDLDSDVGHVGLQLMEQRAMSQNFDTLRSTTPAPHRLGDPDPCNASFGSTAGSNPGGRVMSAASPARVVHVRERSSHKKSHRFAEHSGDALNEATDALEHAKHRRSHSPIDTSNFQRSNRDRSEERDRDDREAHHRRHRRHAPDDDDASSHQRADRHDRRRHAPKDRDRDRLSSLGIAGHSALHRGGFHDADASSNSQAERGDDEASFGAPLDHSLDRPARRTGPARPYGHRAADQAATTSRSGPA
ncbi:microtubule motor protein [Aureococcus anophagefferens]|uniref:Microtubule motor protein n=1 Tax=Aureococcus anophagefferens TaxID=44056 RepID=A0ABR1FYH8_AURAN